MQCQEGAEVVAIAVVAVEEELQEETKISLQHRPLTTNGLHHDMLMSQTADLIASIIILMGARHTIALTL